MIDISVRTNLKEIERKLTRFAAQQVPFAAAQALNAIAKQVQVAEDQNLKKVLDNPTPFTLRSIGVRGANRANQTAIVFMRDIAAAYLAPYQFGGLNKLNGKALLEPINVRVNQYGNLPRSKLQSLKGRKDVFIGRITFKKTGKTVSGVWQRPPIGTRRSGRRGSTGNINVIDGARTGLKLLIRFADAHEVTQHLAYMSVAKQTIAKSFNREFGRALSRAIATANR